MKVSPIHEKSYDKETPIIGWSIYCLGCRTTHEIPVELGTVYSRAKWTFNGNTESPTFSPSLHIRTGKYADPNYVESPDWPNSNVVCHTFVTNGQIQYLGDCTHEYSGKTIELPKVEDWPKR